MSGARCDRFRVERVLFHEYGNLQPGIIYYMDRIKYSVHLCACGCGNMVALDHNTPPVYSTYTHGDLSGTDDKPTVQSSIGKRNDCATHYSITDGEVQWYPN